MATDRSRMVVLALVSIGLIIATAFLLEWFVFAAKGAGRIELGLSSINVCNEHGPCVSLDMKYITGLFPTFATIALWVNVLFGVVIVAQTALRLVNGAANETLTAPAYLLGAGAMLVAGAAGYVFGPELIAGASTNGVLSIERTWAPLLMLAADAAGIAALYFAAREELAGPPVARVVSEPVVAPPPRAPATTTIPIPTVLRGKLAYAALTGEVTRAGIDARREDGTTNLVLWRDVVGAVARRLPPDYEGATFVDIVSTAGATLRLVPWTRLAGDPIDGQDGQADARMRALLAVVVERCPGAHLDQGTRRFLEAGEPAPQLPDLAMLAEHDARLA